MAKRELQGNIVSDKMVKTVVVEVRTLKEHKRYKRRFWTSKRYKAHNENPEFKMGDTVIIQETKPLSKDKRWLVLKKI